jgi:hypothetical protein
MIQRRSFLAVAAAIATALVGTSALGANSSADPDSPRARLTLLPPTGRHDVGTVSLHLVDHNRQDPYWKTPHARELMVSVWYPAGLHRNNQASDDGPADAQLEQRWPRVPWKSSGTLVYYRPQLERHLENLPPEHVNPAPGSPPPSAPPPREVNISLARVDFPITHARLGVPVARSESPYPVVLYLPAGGNAREQGTMLVEDLASRGYIVVAISHTYNASQVEFPDGRVERGVEDPLNIPPHLNIGTNVVQGLHVADARFVIDKLAELAAGLNPDAAGRPLPRGLHRSLDMSKVGMFGHSVGGGATAHALAIEDRIVAGINLDGSILPLTPMPGEPGTPERLEATRLEMERIARLVGARPFMAMTSNKSPEQTGVLLNGFYSKLTGYRRLANLVNGIHGDFEDTRSLLAQLADAGVISTKLLRGRLDPERSVAVQRTYVAAFFDLWLKNKDNHLLDGASDDYPEIELYF